MTHPADRFSYPTFMDAVLAGAETANMAYMDDWIDRWHDGQMEDHAELHDALGLTWEQYGEVVAPGSQAALDAIVKARRAEIDGRQDGPVRFRFGVPASAQESSMMNATMTILENGHAISVALTPPKDLDVSDANVVRTTMSSVFRRFVDQGWTLEIAVGPNDADHKQ